MVENPEWTRTIRVSTELWISPGAAGEAARLNYPGERSGFTSCASPDAGVGVPTRSLIFSCVCGNPDGLPGVLDAGGEGLHGY